ncbi:MAG: YggS family pyridoxal phosphate-dependent enzyme [Anaerolineae bacterium]|nr:YggS family pyridoxal phosphate-dependent enzyme [Anaerolineae bacterium]
MEITIADRVVAVQATIEQACQRAGRSPDEVTLVAVSKTHSVDEIAQAAAAGVRHFGENRIEEALEKIPKLAGQSLHWHMIGHVQSRKARYLTDGFDLLHSLDSVKLAERLSRMFGEQGNALDVLLEMNVSGEASKYGWNAHRWQTDAALRQTLWDEIACILALPGLNVRGLMTMAPIVDDPEQARPVFMALRELRDALVEDFPAVAWADLSMGMTDDYPVAIEEGATLVRIGRAIFGPRGSVSY